MRRIVACRACSWAAGTLWSATRPHHQARSEAWRHVPAITPAPPRACSTRCPAGRPAWRRRGWALVERFDTEFNPDFSAKSPNFRGLVLFCIEADFCTQIRILQHFSRTTRFAILCTDSISKFEQNFVKLFRIFVQNSAKNRYFSTFFIEFCTDFDQNFTEFRRIF